MAVLVVLCLIAVAISVSFEALDVVVRYLTEAERLPTPLTSGSIT